MHATIGELLWAVSSVGSAPRLYKENQFGVWVEIVSAGSEY
jgi:hypothetical protein